MRPGLPDGQWTLNVTNRAKREGSAMLSHPKAVTEASCGGPSRPPPRHTGSVRPPNRPQGAQDGYYGNRGIIRHCNLGEQKSVVSPSPDIWGQGGPWFH